MKSMATDGGPGMMWEDEHFFSLEAYDGTTGEWFGVEMVGSRGEIDDAILRLKRRKGGVGHPAKLRIVETSTQYLEV